MKDAGRWGIGLGGGRNGMNDPENRRSNYVAEGLHKSVIDKRQSLRIEQLLTEARKNHLIIWSHCSSWRPVNTHTINYPGGCCPPWKDIGQSDGRVVRDKYKYVTISDRA